MNNKSRTSLDDYTLFRLLCELTNNEVSSQRELARRLQSALGLVNGYLKVCVDRGWVKVRTLSATRSSYSLSVRGAAERRRLSVRHGRYLDEALAVVLEEYRPLIARLREEGVDRVALCGADPVAFLVCLALQQAGLELSVVMDSRGIGAQFLGWEVVGLAYALLGGTHRIVIASPWRAPELSAALRDLGADPAAILVPPLFLEDCDAD